MKTIVIKGRTYSKVSELESRKKSLSKVLTGTGVTTAVFTLVFFPVAILSGIYFFVKYSEYKQVRDLLAVTR